MELIHKLRDRLQAPLPGIDAQLKMMSTGLRTSPKNTPFRNYDEREVRKAAVMLLLFEKEDGWHTALMQRPESPYAHSKQVSLPGGGFELYDHSLEQAALRETQEEFGIPSQKINMIGNLTELYIPVSGYLVHPFIGYLEEAPIYTPDPIEVAEIIEVPILDLLNPALRKQTNIKTSKGFTLKDVPYFDLQQKVVWGATAMMLSEFVTILEDLDW